MKSRIITKTSAVLMAVSIALTFSACGNSSSGSKKSSSQASSSEKKKPQTTTAIVTEEPTEAETEAPKEITGTQQTWGIFTVLVPDDWTLRGGNFIDEEDPDICKVMESDFYYFEFKNEKEDTQKSQYEYNKKTYTNEQFDLPSTVLNGIEWNGFQYGNDFGGGFELYGQSGGRFLRVSCAGFSFDSQEAQKILSSLTVSPAEEEEETGPSEEVSPE